MIIDSNTILEFSPDPVGPSPPTPIGTWRMLKDHYINNEYILAGEVRIMYDPWVPTADVEPLDARATLFFHGHGPTLGGVIRTQFSLRVISPPVTYWHQISPNVWALTGLGEGMTPINAIVERVEDKEP